MIKLASLSTIRGGITHIRREYRIGYSISQVNKIIINRFIRYSIFIHPILRNISSTSSCYHSNIDSVETTASSSAVIPSSRPKLRIQDILASKTQREFTIPQQKTVGEAISFLVENRLSSALVQNEEGSLVGIFTARDILRFIHTQGEHNRSGQAKALIAPIMQVMTKKEKLVYCSPTDSVKRCREIMFQLKIRNMPVLDRGEVMGIITIKDLADSSFSLIETGGKKGYIHNVTGRKGIPEGTKLRHDDESKTISGKPKIRVNFGSYALPHPFKSPNNVASSRRAYGAKPLCEDITLCEDAHFALRVNGISPDAPSQVYLCVADGVGSWRQYNVDPRQYSHHIVKNAERVILADAQQRSLLHESGWMGSGLGVVDQQPIHPLDVLVDAWNLTHSERVNGSSTFCVATVDKQLNQLSYSNVGDCGLMVVRHIDSETAGYMRERQRPRHLRNTDLKIAFLSQQQLRSFNLPYQLGFSDIPEFKGSFETPNDCDTASIALLPGDIIILATDGLYDNIDLHEIVEEISHWERQWFPSIDGSDLQKPSSKGEEAVQALSKQLVNKAREYSLDQQRDSPFAVLAKENDIMWGGGMPDDTTVIVARIYNSNP